MKQILSALLLTLLTVSAAQALSKDERRQQMIAQTLPAADRAGIFLIFPMEAGGANAVFDIIFFPDQVSEKQVQSRITKLCAAQKPAGSDGRLYVWRAAKADVVKLADGSQRPVIKTTLSCLPR